MATMQVFLSHSSADKDVAERVVMALRGAGADVWFDEHNLGATQLLDEIQRQLRARPVFIVLLSENAFASDWVKRECKWAWNVLLRDPSHIILPLVIAPIDLNAFDTMLFLEDFKRIEGPHNTPYAEAEMLERTLRLLALTPAGAAPAPVTPQPAESLDDLMTQGDALAAQERWADALPFFQHVTDRDPTNTDAWRGLGWMLGELGRYEEAVVACDRALAINDQLAAVWTNKGVALANMGSYDEALPAYEEALALDPELDFAWVNQGIALHGLGRDEEALEAYDEALALDPDLAWAWANKGSALNALGRYEEALEASEGALALDPNDARAWANKGGALNGLERYEEALEACEKALARDPNDGVVWFNKGVALANLERYEEALIALDRGFDRDDYRDWQVRADVYRALGRDAEAEVAERRAKELGV